MLPSWGSLSQLNRSDKENSVPVRFPNVTYGSQSVESLKYREDEVTAEFEYQRYQFHTAAFLEFINENIKRISDHSFWTGSGIQDDITRLISSFETKSLFSQPKGFLLSGECNDLHQSLLQLLKLFMSYIHSKQAAFEGSIGTLHSNAKKAIQEQYNQLHLQHSKAVNELHGTIEDLYKQNSKLQHEISKLQGGSELQAKELSKLKTELQHQYDSLLKDIKAQAEATQRGLKESLAKEKKATHELEESLKQKIAELNHKLKAQTKKLVHLFI